MCLTINPGQEKFRAKADIVCYKIVQGKDIKHIETFYQYVSVKIGKTYKSELFVDMKFPKEVYVGIHSYVNIKDAINNVNCQFPSWTYTGYEIFIIECIIPKDSHYYLGTFNYHPCYASDKITYVKHIENAKELCV